MVDLLLVGRQLSALGLPELPPALLQLVRALRGKVDLLVQLSPHAVELLFLLALLVLQRPVRVL